MNIAVLGAWHVHTMEYSTALQKNPDSTLCCLWDSDPERGTQMAEKLGVPFQPDLDAVEGRNAGSDPIWNKCKGVRR